MLNEFHCKKKERTGASLATVLCWWVLGWEGRKAYLHTFVIRSCIIEVTYRSHIEITMYVYIEANTKSIYFSLLLLKVMVSEF